MGFGLALHLPPRQTMRWKMAATWAGSSGGRRSSGFQFGECLGHLDDGTATDGATGGECKDSLAVGAPVKEDLPHGLRGPSLVWFSAQGTANGEGVVAIGVEGIGKSRGHVSWVTDGARVKDWKVMACSVPRWKLSTS